MADLRGGTTVSGWPILHSGLPNAYLSGSLAVGGDIRAARVYNAVFNDYAEYFLMDEPIEPGDVVCKSPDGDGYIKSKGTYDKLVVGVCSNTYAYCIGGEGGRTKEDQEKKFAPIGLAGRVGVKVIGRVEPGDLLVSSDIPGIAMTAKEYIPGTVIGKALEGNIDGKIIQMLVMNI